MKNKDVKEKVLEEDNTFVDGIFREVQNDKRSRGVYLFRSIPCIFFVKEAIKQTKKKIREETTKDVIEKVKNILKRLQDGETVRNQNYHIALADVEEEVEGGIRMSEKMKITIRNGVKFYEMSEGYLDALKTIERKSERQKCEKEHASDTPSEALKKERTRIKTEVEGLETDYDDEGNIMLRKKEVVEILEVD